MNRQVIIVDYWGLLSIATVNRVLYFSSNLSIVMDEETKKNMSLLDVVSGKLKRADSYYYVMNEPFFSTLESIKKRFRNKCFSPIILGYPDLLSAIRLELHNHPEYEIEIELFVTMENGQVRKILIDKDGKFTDTPENMILYNEWEKPYFDFISQCLDI